MRGTLRGSLVIMVAVLALLIAVSWVSAQQCSNSCADGLCVVDGILNEPLGNASLALNAQCQLLINGIGSSGRDGVIQPNLNSTVMSTGLATPNFSGSAAGTTAIITQHGVVDGIPNQEISVMTIVNFNHDDMRVSADCQEIGVAGYTVEIYSGLRLVTRATGVDVPTLILPKEDILEMTCGIEPNGDTFTSFRLRNPQPMTFQAPSTTPGQFTGDFVLITAFSPKRIPSLQEDIHNIFIDAGQVVLSSLFAGPLQKRCTTNADELAAGVAPCNFDNPGEGKPAGPVAALLPTVRSVAVGEEAGAFAAMINPNSGPDAILRGCGVAPKDLAFANHFRFGTTKPSTNTLTGLLNYPVDIKPGETQTFAFSVTAMEEVAPSELPLVFGCANSGKVETIIDVNSFLFSASATHPPDVIMLSAAPGNDGTLTLASAGAFAMATVNVGASALLTLTPDTGGAILPLTLTICETNPTTGACLTPPAPSVTTQIDMNATPTFSVFAIATGPILFDPAVHRIFVRVRDAGGIIRGATSVAVRTLGPEVAWMWFDLLYDLVKAKPLSPPVAARAYGIASVALYESVIAGAPGHRSLGGQLNGLGTLPQPQSDGEYHWPTAANSAMASIVRSVLPGASETSLGAIDALEQHFAEQFQGQVGVPPSVFARSVAYGQSVAAAVAAWAATDGFSTLDNCPYTPPVGLGFWVPTPPNFTALPLQPCWGQVRPFVLTSGAECAPPPAPAYSEDPSSPLYALAKEVYDTRNNLTAEQTTIARYWADTPGATGTPPGHWIAIVGQIARKDGLSLVTAAEAYARVGIAAADAFISSWNTKYVFNLLRPVTYIQKVIDLNWTPLLTTPNFPEYTSGHSAQSGAAATVLTDQFGVKAFTDTLHTDHGLVPPQQPRSFNSFIEAAQEAALSRLYGGIHFRVGNEAGFNQGVCIGQVIGTRIRFRE